MEEWKRMIEESPEKNVEARRAYNLSAGATIAKDAKRYLRAVKAAKKKKEEGLILVDVMHAAKSTGKKLVAVFSRDGKSVSRMFGAAGMSDYTIHKDRDRRKRYWTRHEKDLRTNDPTRAGYLSYYILWNLTSLRNSISDFRKRLVVYNKTGTFPRKIKGGKQPPYCGKIPEKYAPKSLSKKDREKAMRNVCRRRDSYKKGKYLAAAKIKAYPKKESRWIKKAKKMYKVDSVTPRNEDLVRASGCSALAMRRITKKGRGAYYSGGSRPNQTPSSWACARLGSALVGGPASCRDRHILEDGCDKKKRAYTLMAKTCKK